jgi:CheY-like chemotaxis protein
MGEGKSKSKSILVVEDEPIIAKICTRTLSSEGFQVESAVNGKVALGILNQKKYNLCLIDIRTPTMNGVELYEHLEENYPEMTSRVIFTTGDVLSSNIKTFLEKTNRPYLPKPFTPDELRAIVKRVL